MQDKHQRPGQVEEHYGNRKRQDSGHRANRHREATTCIEGTPVCVSNRDERNTNQAGADQKRKTEIAHDQLGLD